MVSNEIAAVRQLIGKFTILINWFSPAAITPLTNPNLPFFPADPGFAKRTAKFSRFGKRSFNDRINQLGLNSIKSEIGASVTTTEKGEKQGAFSGARTNRKKLRGVPRVQHYVRLIGM
ncbi:hypothetical protein QVD17_02304 [Tagetes erecta]|uniref:Uncharacterized protein n=1 Tax=Tagetes erecta TaxID=13708 RepID=A0AAD8LBE7_TARER|nr:hypothetical protein QVD17_02304 [Tagetes erecta]